MPPRTREEWAQAARDWEEKARDAERQNDSRSASIYHDLARKCAEAARIA